MHVKVLKYTSLIQEFHFNQGFRNHHGFIYTFMHKGFHYWVVYNNRGNISSSGRILKVWYKHTIELQALFRNQDFEDI